MPAFAKGTKIYVAGHRGMVGSALVRNLQSKGYTNIVYRTRSELDLLDQKAVRDCSGKSGRYLCQQRISC